MQAEYGVARVLPLRVHRCLVDLLGLARRLDEACMDREAGRHGVEGAARHMLDSAQAHV